jgi:hypothetical protein
MEGERFRGSVRLAPPLSVVIALSGAVASLFGVWIGNQNATQVQRENLRHDDLRAVRDLRREAYESFVAAVDKYKYTSDQDTLRRLEGASEAARRSMNSSGRRATPSDVHSDAALMNDRFTTLSIVGSRRAVDLANRVFLEMASIPILELGASEKEWGELYSKIRAARAALLTQVRLELGIQD